jgi:hypothetical protein
VEPGADAQLDHPAQLLAVAVDLTVNVRRPSPKYFDDSAAVGDRQEIEAERLLATPHLGIARTQGHHGIPVVIEQEGVGLVATECLDDELRCLSESVRQLERGELEQALQCAE